MKIKDFKTFVVGNPDPGVGGQAFVYLKLITDSGVEGLGEAYSIPFHPHLAAKMIEDVVERHVIGAEPHNIEKLWRIIYMSGYSARPDLAVLGVISAVDMACWDIIGKEAGRPVRDLLGGTVHEKLRSYTYLYPEPGDTAPVYTDPDAAAERAAQYVKQGFTAIKFDPMQPYGAFDPRMPSGAALAHSERYVARIREAVGGEVDLLFGTHGQFTPAGAIRLAKRLEKYDPLWFEEPVPAENAEEMARVARATSIPVATGERLTTKYEFARLLKHGSAAIFQFALGRVGGLLEAKKICAMAEAHYVQIAPHLYTSSVQGAACCQLDACTPNFLIQESIKTWGGFQARILKKPIIWQDGYIIPPSGPGLGVELNEEVAQAHPFTGNQLHISPVEEPVSW